MVVELIEGVVNVFPLPKADPPLEAAYHLTVPEDAVAPKTTVPFPHLLPGVVVLILPPAGEMVMVAGLLRVDRPSELFT